MKTSFDAFQVVADPSRRQMLKLLTKDRMTINALAENFDMSRPAVSKHVKILHDAGFIAIEEAGRERYCLICEDGFRELQDWLSYFDRFWMKRLRRLEQALDAVEKKSNTKRVKRNKR